MRLFLVGLVGFRRWLDGALASDPLRMVRDFICRAASRHAIHLLPDGLRGRVYRPQGWISPVLLVNGLIQGTWRHEVKGNRVEVTIEPFGKPPAWMRRGAAEEAERLAAFLGGQLDLAISVK